MFISYKYELKAWMGKNKNNFKFDVTILFSLHPNDHAKKNLCLIIFFNFRIDN